MASVTHLPLRFSDGRTVPMPPELIELARGSNEGSTTHKKYLHASITTEQLARSADIAIQEHKEVATQPLPAPYNAAEIDAHIRQRIQTGALKALQLIEDIIEGRLPASIALRARYASLHLSRAGYGPITKTTSLSQHLTREDIEQLKLRCTSAASEDTKE